MFLGWDRPSQRSHTTQEKKSPGLLSNSHIASKDGSFPDNDHLNQPKCPSALRRSASPASTVLDTVLRSVSWSRSRKCPSTPATLAPSAARTLSVAPPSASGLARPARRPWLVALTPSPPPLPLPCAPPSAVSVRSLRFKVVV